jgi:hypothetical protein
VCYHHHQEVAKVTASKLRENVYQILDEAIETGVPVEIVRKGVVLRIVVDQPLSKLARLKKRSIFEGDPDDIIGMNWSSEWSELK